MIAEHQRNMRSKETALLHDRCYRESDLHDLLVNLT